MESRFRTSSLIQKPHLYNLNYRKYHSISIVLTQLWAVVVGCLCLAVLRGSAIIGVPGENQCLPLEASGIDDVMRFANVRGGASQRR